MKFNQSKYIHSIAKWLSYNCHQVKHIDVRNILFMRKNIDNTTKPCEIYRLDSSLVKAFGFYYLIEVYPTFDIDPEHLQYRNIFHCLRHIPKEYIKNNYLTKHTIEAFDDEHLFDEKFKNNFGDSK